jgi:hypothetical protein
MFYKLVEFDPEKLPLGAVLTRLGLHRLPRFGV